MTVFNVSSGQIDLLSVLNSGDVLNVLDGPAA
jgi:hypothetical protein